MSFVHALSVCIALQIETVTPCSPLEPQDGELIIADAQLFGDTSLLLTISEYGGSTTFCKEMDVFDGSVSAAASCDAFNGTEIREWSEGDVDGANTSVSSVDIGDHAVSVRLFRNGEPLLVENMSVPFDGASEVYFEALTLNAVHTTIVMLSEGAYSAPFMFGLVFAASESNNFTLYAVAPVGDAWQDFEFPASHREVSVFESAQVLQLPLVCCLCESYLAAPYALSVDEAGKRMNFTLADAVWGPAVDAAQRRIYRVGESTVTVFDVANASTLSFAPDLSSDGFATTLSASSFGVRASLFYVYVCLVLKCCL